MPKRLRPYFLWRRKLLGDLARVAARTATAFVRTTLDEPELSVGIVLSIQTHGSLLNRAAYPRPGHGWWFPTRRDLRAAADALDAGADGGVPAGGAEAVRGARAVRAGGSRGDVWSRGRFETCPYSGFSVHDGVWLDEEDQAAHERLARYCARCPVSLERLEYDRESETVTYTSDKSDGPTAGRHTFEAVEFIARHGAHPGQGAGDAGAGDVGAVRNMHLRGHGNHRGERRKAGDALDGLQS